MSSNKYYDEWETPREAILIRDVAYLTWKSGGEPGVEDVAYWARYGERVQIVGRMTEDTREMYGGKWLHNAIIRNGGSLVEHGVDFEFIG